VRGGQHIHDEEGAAIVIMMLAFPVMLLFLAFAVNVARWWVVDRHMQIQADAAALAAGTEIARDPLNCTQGRVVGRAQQYAGIPTAVGSEPSAGYNGAAIVKTDPTTYDPNFRFNSATYADGGAADADAASYAGANANPCVSGIADVKLTTTGVPGVLKAIGVAANVHAHARVQVLKAGAPLNTAPFGVETADPKRVYAELVDLSDGSAVQVYKGGTAVNGFDLTKGGIVDGNISWSSTGVYALQSSASGRIGVRIRVSDTNASIACTDPAVHCYGTGLVGTQQNSLDTVRVFNDPNAAGAFGVRLGAVVVAPATATTSCDPAAAEAGTFTTTCTAASVTATLAGLNTNQTVVVKANGTTLASLGSGRWGADVPIAQGSGANEITIDWSQKGGSITTSTGTKSCPANNPCTGTFSNVHRAFAAAYQNAGVIKHLTTIVGSGTYAAANNVPESSCSTASPCPITISAALGGSVSLASPSDPAIPLRLGSSGSLTGLLDCDPNTTSAEQEVAVGCGSARYTENDGGVACATKYNNAGQLFGDTAAMPWPCVASEQGNKTPKVPIGLTARILCAGHELSCLSGASPACTAHNNWPNFTPDDPRIVPLFLVPIGSSAQNGSSVYSILGFAAFYVTGWSGSPCTGTDNEIPAQYAKDKASVFGHWIKYIVPDLTGDEGAAGAACDLASVSICTPVLVK
jgi:hypothetical protein